MVTRGVDQRRPGNKKRSVSYRPYFLLVMSAGMDLFFLQLRAVNFSIGNQFAIFDALFGFAIVDDF